MKHHASKEPNPPAPLPYEGRGVSKPLPPWGRGLERGFFVYFITFQTSSYILEQRRQTARGIAKFYLYQGNVCFDGQEFTIPALAGE
ncbi:MAG: hypothetical protein KME31_17960 [Tolypothrix carrinoi HA7290-LM1]|jgi:hypothetical protein|nr:hypothetical protein [Tolypothrix carrinoi HA7290-LM1]